MIAFKTELRDKLEMTKDDFRNEVKSTILVALNDKEYPIEQVSAHMIAEDITGIWGEHQMPEVGMDIIREELALYEVKKGE